jgi:hypothetical protein
LKLGKTKFGQGNGVYWKEGLLHAEIDGKKR